MKTETFNAAELSRLNKNAETVSAKFYDFDGNQTKTLGLNDHDAVASVMAFLRARLQPLQSHAIYVSYLPATNFRGSRVKLKTYDLTGKAKSRVLSYDHAFNSAADIAAAALKAAGFEIIGRNERGPESVFLTEWDAETLKTFFKVK